MQVTETKSEGLRRELQVVIDQSELGRRFSEQLDKIKDRVTIKGFRPGKVPLAHIKRVHGRSLMADVIQNALIESSNKALEDRKERPAMQPQIKLTEDEQEIERILRGETDLTYTMAFEVLPAFEIADLSKLELERPVAEVDDAEVAKSIEQLRQSSTTYLPEAGRVAEDGDQVTVDFVGSIDGEPFEGGKGEDAQVVLGRGGFIPGFEEGLKGIKPGEERSIEAEFPAAYPVKELAGKKATFAVTCKAVARPVLPELDDDFAKGFGLESLEDLKQAMKERIASEYARISRQKAKRALLDALDAAHSFELPPSLVDTEFEGIWRQVTASLERANRTFEDEGKTEESERAEYRKLAERRVRLGLVLSEIGDKAEIKVGDDELARALAEQARQFPGQSKQIYDFYRKNPGALARLRAPIFEEKVVDHILGLAKISDKIVSREELLADIEDEAGLDDGHEHHHHDHDHDHDHHHDHDHGHDHNHDHDHHHGHGHSHSHKHD